MAGELLKNITGIDIVHVPYKGSTGMRTDIFSGQIQLLFNSVPTMAPHDQGRHGPRARHQRQDPLAHPARRADACRSRRARLSSNVMGRLHGAKATPQPIVDLLNRTITTILQRPDIKDAWEKQGATPLVMTQAAIRRLHDRREIVKWAKVIKDNHIASDQLGETMNEMNKTAPAGESRAKSTGPPKTAT